MGKGREVTMIVFSVGKGRYNVYVYFNGTKLVGYLTPEDGQYKSETNYQVTRLVEDGREVPHGTMTMSEARNLFEAIYGG
jgi:hypothetical protein